MANEIITTDQADGRPPLASLALSRHRWTIEAAHAALCGDPVSQIDRAIAHLAEPLAPVPTIPAERALWKVAMDERLRRLAVKISPSMSPSQTQPWRDVMTDALSDLPAMVALTAAKRAIHRPMSFLNEVEGVVREIAAEIHAERRRALERLNDLRAAILRPRHAALPPQEDGAPFSADEIRKMPRAILEMGVAGGWISEAGAAEARQEVEAIVEAEPISRQPKPQRAAPIEASLEQYLELGLSEDEARQAMKERRRLLSRGAPKAVGAVASDVIGQTAKAA